MVQGEIPYILTALKGKSEKGKVKNPIVKKGKEKREK